MFVQFDFCVFSIFETGQADTLDQKLAIIFFNITQNGWRMADHRNRTLCCVQFFDHF